MDTVRQRLAEHFRACLDKGLGDLETMLAGIWYRMENNGSKLDPGTVPPSYRSPKLRDYLRHRLGARKTTLWGPTALRGRLNPEKKQHIIDFLKVVNELPDDSEELRHAFEDCGKLYVHKVNAAVPEVVLPSESTAQMKLISALRVGGTVGKIQQGIVYAILELKRRLKGEDFVVETKRTHAGDQQSGVRGDVLALRGNEPLTVYEVKGVTINRAAAEMILRTHGEHGYALFILGLGFNPPELKDKLSSLENTFAIGLEDFVLTLLSELVLATAISPEELLMELVKIYNVEFCDRIENDVSIKIVLD